MLHHDARFATPNTNLAACLGALRIPIKNTDPCSRVQEGEIEPGQTPRTVVTFYFEPEGLTGPNGEPAHSASVIAKAWEAREEFERLNPGHALTEMREGLESLGWLTGVYYGRHQLAESDVEPDYQTDDIDLAACFRAAGHPLIRFTKPFFHFHVAEAAREEIIEEFECYRHGTSATCHRRRALEVRRLLLDLVKRAPLLLHYTHGDPMEGGRDGLLPVGCPKAEIEKFFRVLYGED